ncbi:alginate lyase family protein [Sphingomonas sp. R86521]|uniref:alginate lyase family protein n=1 Tax=Sphingomonas sp. R86521 TaxID=3093860 RepID=UPI0036D2F2F7
MMDRRSLLGAGLATLVAPAGALVASPDLRTEERKRVVRMATTYLGDPPRTITSIAAPRSPGDTHDYYSEADYWWPDAAAPGGPYVRRDGFSNPSKFDGHRDALIAVGVRVPALVAAWSMTRDKRFSRAAAAHLRAWFVNRNTRMAPNLAHAQAIIGRDTGRAIGIIDTLQIVEVARAAKMLGDMEAPGYDARVRSGVEAWFREYLRWMTTSPAGIEERDQKNNHGTCWLLQCAAFADLIEDEATLAVLRTRFATVIVPDQISVDGRQPRELARTKPYSYSLFNLDVLAAACRILSSRGASLWTVRGADSGSVADAIGFMVPFIRNKARWPYPADVEHFDALPVRQPSLLLGGTALDRPDWVALWRTLDPDPKDPEIVRNFPIRQPVLWAA